jgi:hypothetical protein
MTEPQRLAMTARVERGESITLEDLRLLAAPGSTFDSFKDTPVYARVGDRYHPITDFSFVSGPYESRIEIQTGEGMTRYELDKAQRAARPVRAK